MTDEIPRVSVLLPAWAREQPRYKRVGDEIYKFRSWGPAPPREHPGQKRLQRLREILASRAVNKPPAPVCVPKGRPARRDAGFAVLAGSLWLEAKRKSSRVSIDALGHIAAELDRRGYVPPAKYLEKASAESLKLYNRNHANSSQGAIKTWTDLVRIRDKDHLRGMRRLLSRCATEPRTHRVRK